MFMTSRTHNGTIDIIGFKDGFNLLITALWTHAADNDLVLAQNKTTATSATVREDNPTRKDNPDVKTATTDITTSSATRTASSQRMATALSLSSKPSHKLSLSSRHHRRSLSRKLHSNNV